MSLRRPNPRDVPTDEELLAGPHDACQRCGRPTPQGVGMCATCNPSGLRGPSATQVHGTIVAAVGAGFLALAILGKLALSGVGPFPARVVAATVRPDGGLNVTLSVTNDGSKTSPATCRVNRGGVNAPDDVLFLTDPIQAGASVTFQRSGPPRASDEPVWSLDRLAVKCD